MQMQQFTLKRKPVCFSPSQTSLISSTPRNLMKDFVGIICEDAPVKKSMSRKVSHQVKPRNLMKDFHDVLTPCAPEKKTKICKIPSTLKPCNLMKCL